MIKTNSPSKSCQGEPIHRFTKQNTSYSCMVCGDNYVIFDHVNKSTDNKDGRITIADIESRIMHFRHLEILSGGVRQ